MINAKDNPVEFSLLQYELIDAKGHIDDLLKNLDAEDYDEVEFRIDLAHIFAHLNRAWNSREHIGEINSDDWKKYSEFPKDLDWT